MQSIDHRNMDINDIDEDVLVMTIGGEDCSKGDPAARRMPCEQMQLPHDADACTVTGTGTGTSYADDEKMTPSGHNGASIVSLSSTTPSAFSPSTSKRRRVSFRAGYATEIYEIPPLAEYYALCDKDNDNDNDNDTDADAEKNYDNLRKELFYNDEDYERFRANERKRYQKMIAKKLQKMVQEKLQPTINEAVANGATVEDIEAMMPNTHEEAIAILGDDVTVSSILPPAAFAAAFGSGHHGFGDVETTTGTGKRTEQRTIRTTRCSVSAIRTAEGDDCNTDGSSLTIAVATVAEQVARKEEGERGTPNSGSDDLNREDALVCNGTHVVGGSERGT